jgi:hypothetical protein
MFQDGEINTSIVSDRAMGTEWDGRIVNNGRRSVDAGNHMVEEAQCYDV